MSGSSESTAAAPHEAAIISRSGNGKQGHPHAVNALCATLARLVQERQELRARGAAFECLEENRLAIVDRQWSLAYAFIAARGVKKTSRMDGPSQDLDEGTVRARTR